MKESGTLDLRVSRTAKRLNGPKGLELGFTLQGVEEFAQCHLSTVEDKVPFNSSMYVRGAYMKEAYVLEEHICESRITRRCVYVGAAYT